MTKKAKTNKTNKVKLEIEAEERVGPLPLRLHEEIGKGKVGDMEFVIRRSFPDRLHLFVASSDRELSLNLNKVIEVMGWELFSRVRAAADDT